MTERSDVRIGAGEYGPENISVISKIITAGPDISDYGVYIASTYSSMWVNGWFMINKNQTYGNQNFNIFTIHNPKNSRTYGFAYHITYGMNIISAEWPGDENCLRLWGPNPVQFKSGDSFTFSISFPINEFIYPF